MRQYKLSTYIQLELTSKCRLACPKCVRTQHRGQYQIKDLPLDLVNRIIENPKFKKIKLCGSIGDPIYHPHFLEIVKKIKSLDKRLKVATNGTGKSLKWWRQVFGVLHSGDSVCFGLDGLQDTAHLYRVNTDFEHVFEVMKLGAEINKARIEWQFIPFNFNQHQIEKAKSLALENNINFIILKSSRFTQSDSLLPAPEWLPDSLKSPNNYFKSY